MGFFKPLRHLWWALGQLYYDLLPLILKLNLPWTITMIPLFFPATYIGFILAQPETGEMIRSGTLPAALLIYAPLSAAVALLLAGPGTAAMYYCAYQFSELEPLSLRLFIASFKRFFLRGWLLGLLDLLALMILLVGVSFYWNSGEVFLQVIAVVFVYFFLFWLLLQPFLYPLMVRLNLGILHTFRNSAVLVAGHLTAALGLAVITLIGVVLFPLLNVLVLLLGPAVMALTTHRTLEDLLAAYDIQAQTDSMDDP